MASRQCNRALALGLSLALVAGAVPAFAQMASSMGEQHSMTHPSSSSIASYVASNQQAGDNWFGGPSYMGKPALAATAALVNAGGGAKDFSFSKALVAMLGEKTVNAEVAKLSHLNSAEDPPMVTGAAPMPVSRS